MADSKTVTPKLAYLDIAPDALYHETYTSFTKIASEFIVELETAYDHHKSKHTSDPIIEEATFFANLNDSLLVNFNGDFLLFWLDKYHTAHDAVKRELDLILGENNVFFKNFNESLGSLKHADFIKDRSTISTLDADGNITDTPYPYNGCTDQILNLETKIISLNLSKFTNSVFKRNIRHIGEPQRQLDDGTTGFSQGFATSTKTHGVNLVTDYEHYKRMKGIVTDIVKIVDTDLKDLKNALIFMSTYIEEQSIFKETVEINIEDAMVKVGFMKNKLINTDEVTTAVSTLNSDVLGIEGSTHAKTKDIKNASTEISSAKASPNISERPTVDEVLNTSQAKNELNNPSNKEKVVLQDSIVDKDEFDLDNNIFTETTTTLGDSSLPSNGNIANESQLINSFEPSVEEHPCDVLAKMTDERLNTWTDSKGKTYSYKEVNTACKITQKNQSLNIQRLNNDQSKKPIQQSHPKTEPPKGVILQPDYSSLYSERDSTTALEIIFSSSDNITNEFKKASAAKEDFDKSFGSYYPSGKLFQVKAYVFIEDFQILSDDGSVVIMQVRAQPKSIPNWSTQFLPFYQLHQFNFKKDKGGLVPTEDWPSQSLKLIKGFVIADREDIDSSAEYLQSVQDRSGGDYRPQFY